jgi:hypothetical protein
MPTNPGSGHADQDVRCPKRLAGAGNLRRPIWLSDDGGHHWPTMADGGVWRTLQNVKLRMDCVRHISLPDATPASRLIRQHAAIVDAIAARDPDAVEAMMQKHLEELLSSLPGLVARLPKYFDSSDVA